jgi:uncharacterized protein involved in type VI secretion and phage assembly
MHTTKLIQTRGVEAIGRFYSRYRGVVLNNNDPDNLQRLEVMIPNLHVGGLKVWARSASHQGGVNYGMKYFTPLPGEVVWVEFEKGNPMKAIWSYHGWAKVEVPEELKSNTVAGLISPNGNKVILNDTDGVLSIQVEKKVSILTEEEGESISLGIPEKCSISLTGDQIEITKGESTITLSDDGITLQKGGSNLKKTLEDLISAVSSLPGSLTIMVTDPQSGAQIPATVTSTIDLQLNPIKQELSSYLK